MQQHILLEEAQKLVDETGNYSVSHLQRNLEIGYNTASKTMKEIKANLFHNENKLDKKLQPFLDFFTKEELLNFLQGVSFLNNSKLAFFLVDEYFKIYIDTDILTIKKITFMEEELETQISKDDFKQYY
jgi:hypothetical protein